MNIPSLKSIYIGTVSNFRLYIDILFFPALIAMYAFGGMGIVLLSIPAFFIHELAHIIAANLFECKISSFTLMPIGGTLEIDNLDCTGTAQLCFIYSFAPLTNVMLYSLFYAIGIKSNSLVALQFALINGILAVFSFLPIYPLDGGNILKTLLKSKLDERRTFLILFIVNLIFSVILIVFSFMSFIKFRNFLWQPVVIAIFFLYSAFKEKQNCTSNNISNIINKDNMLIRQKIIPANQLYILESQTIASALKAAKHNAFNTFIITDDKLNIINSITEKDLINAAVKYGIHKTLSEIKF